MTDGTPRRESGRIAGRGDVWGALMAAVAVAAMLPSVLAGTARWWWLGDLCVHFRMPYVMVLSGLTMLFCIRRRWRWLWPIGLVLGVNVWLLLPLYRPAPAAAGNTEPLRMLLANVYIGNTQAQPILDTIRRERPDVVLLMEVDDRWLDALEELRTDYPHRLFAIRDEKFGQLGPFGLVLFSRSPLVSTQVVRLGTVRVPVLVATLEAGGVPWTVVGAHPYPPVSPTCAEARDSLLRELGELVRGLDRPTVVLGDLNTTRWSPHFSDLLAAGGLEDTSLGFGYQPTWSNILGLPVIPIDHVLVSPEVVVLDRRIGPDVASDHRPVVVDLTLPTSNSGPQERSPLAEANSGAYDEAVASPLAD